ncbi:glycosyltransferase family 2 protein [Megamonas hypermegale]|uniref:glycosyltransferase family 2 protein n=1 Tax=Megamonas hypermegale TaxID=158847 RepID=UPI001957ED2C|nr:glycosyltransferase family 2 protein [Megamonas hypermegale]MBM6761411.1 glycosyltransferase [Megamonas hypermegale]
MKKISLISVTYNADNNIENMIKSVINQRNLSDIEFIIIDGLSTDRTCDIIKKYDSYIDIFLSEKDNGIYDAMNKGLKFATGEYVYFLGADDTLYNNHVLANVVSYLNDTVDILSGNVYLVDNCLHMKKLSTNKYTKKEIINGKMLPHQGLFVKRTLALKYKFNIKYKIASDYEMLLKIIKDNYNILYIDDIIANYNVSGISSLQTEILIKEYTEILKENISEENAILFNKKINNNFLKKYVKKFIKNCVGNRVLKKLSGWENY